MSAIDAHKLKAKKDDDAVNEVSFSGPECPVEKVTVYPDRAEVCRQVDGFLASGLNKVVITKLPDTIDPDSIRVEGKGTATIIEVAFYSESVPSCESDLSHHEKELEAEKELLQRWKLDLNSEISVLRKKKDLLDSFASAASAGVTDKNDKGCTAKDANLNEKFFKGMSGFLDLYTKEANTILKKEHDFLRQKQNLDRKHNANTQNLVALRTEKMSTSEVRKCVIMLECKNQCKVSLLMSYVTRSASWKPSYDIRMSTADEHLRITYHGQIQQTTGEDWTDAKLYLSTAEPSVGGEIPELCTAELHLANPPSPSPFARMRSLAKMQSYSLDRCVAKGGSTPFRSISFAEKSVPPAPEPPVAIAKMMPVGSGMAATMFEVTHRSTIPSDNMQHKVTVGMVDIKPKVTYISVPQRVPHAFMLAKVTNTSSYTFLAGDTNIFQNETFVGKASMKNVYPAEEFECSLGADAGVKITYKPLKKYRASSGIISRVLSNTFEQVIEVKNTHDYDVEILVMDQLPRSADDHIKVHLVEPQVDSRHPERTKDKNVILNKNNNLEWTLEVKKQETREITLKYTVEHPAGLDLCTEEVKP